ncbi:hypothetical protein CARUB_v10011419mg [Capsella rubella]|uniref:Uncharacterized protein n=1 Tax=Capsella rubella TaxID=81985 RepID=R0I3P8_9BRAS|nr:hypothetical protein CARUB_v10011419mg [Capsella rubella]
MVTLTMQHSKHEKPNHTNFINKYNKIIELKQKNDQKMKPDANATTDANNAGTNIAASEVGLGAGASTVVAAAAEKAIATTIANTIIFIFIASIVTYFSLMCLNKNIFSQEKDFNMLFLFGFCVWYKSLWGKWHWSIYTAIE